MAEADVIVQIINNVGFPIVVAGALFWQNTKTNDQYQTLLKELTDIIDNNTRSIKELSDRLGGKDVRL